MFQTKAQRIESYFIVVTHLLIHLEEKLVRK